MGTCHQQAFMQAFRHFLWFTMLNLCWGLVIIDVGGVNNIMEIRVLKYFLMVAREENITKAAALLHLTQPTLSRQIMHLEEELGAKLFHRSKHSIILTNGMLFLSEQIRKFQQKYPLVQFSIHSAIADDIKERVEKGILDIGLPMEPADVGKYEFIHMPQKEKGVY